MSGGGYGGRGGGQGVRGGGYGGRGATSYRPNPPRTGHSRPPHRLPSTPLTAPVWREPPVRRQEEVAECREADPAVYGPRVAQLLAGRTFGLFAVMIQKQYEKRWGEGLPGGWVGVLQGAGELRVEGGEGNNPLCIGVVELEAEKKPVSLENSLTVETIDSLKQTDEKPEQDQEKKSSLVQHLHMQLPPAVAVLERCLSLPPAPLPRMCRDLAAPAEEDYWDVRVCLVPSGGVTFLVRSYLETGLYAELQRSMEDFYRENWQPVELGQLQRGDLVAVRQEDRWGMAGTKL